jgi:hypothetical protein
LAILTGSLIVAACGSSSIAPQTLQPNPAGTTATNTAPWAPPATPSQASPSGSSAPGVTVADTAHVIERLDWSPSGTLLEVVTSAGRTDTGFRVDVLGLAGQKVASFDVIDMAWVDDSHLMTVAASPDDATHESATVHSMDGAESSVVPGTFGGVLGNGHGSVALLAPVTATDDPASESFQIWSNGQLGPSIAGYGQPMVWSPDGRLLALIARASTGDGATGIGGPIPGTLSVLKLPEKAAVLSRPLDDIRGLDVYFSPDGTRLATSGGTVWDLADGRIWQVAGRPQGWTSAGALVVVGEDQRVSLWTPAGTTLVPDAFEWAVFGPNAGDVATLPAANQNPDNPALPTAAVVRRMGASAPIALNASIQLATWSSSGICFIATGTADAQAGDDRLLRVELAAN